MYIEIIRRPFGDAPEWVRDGWIGARLPLAATDKTSWQSVSIFERRKGLFPWLWMTLTGQTRRVQAYAVIAKDAVDILDRQDVRAANWWHENVPELLDGSQLFLFDAACCELRGG